MKVYDSSSLLFFLSLSLEVCNSSVGAFTLVSGVNKLLRSDNFDLISFNSALLELANGDIAGGLRCLLDDARGDELTPNSKETRLLLSQETPPPENPNLTEDDFFLRFRLLTAVSLSSVASITGVDRCFFLRRDLRP